jgi:hypothetical protein
VRKDGEIFLIAWGGFEVFLRDLNDTVEDVGFEFLQLFFVVGLDHPVDLTKGLTKFRVEVVLDAVVRPA